LKRNKKIARRYRQIWVDNRVLCALTGKTAVRGHQLIRDVRYGPSERHLVDIFTPTTPSAAPRPILLLSMAAALLVASGKFRVTGHL